MTALVNNAGRNSYADPVTMSEAKWRDVFSVDLESVWPVAPEMPPDMIATWQGAILNIASLHSDMTYPGIFRYAAAKSGVVGLTRSLALEVGSHQIRVNAPSPVCTETALVAEFFVAAPPALRETVIAAHPMRRMAKPSEIANCAAFLISMRRHLSAQRTGGPRAAWARASPGERQRSRWASRNLPLSVLEASEGSAQKLSYRQIFEPLSRKLAGIRPKG